MSKKYIAPQFEFAPMASARHCRCDGQWTNTDHYAAQSKYQHLPEGERWKAVFRDNPDPVRRQKVWGAATGAKPPQAETYESADGGFRTVGGPQKPQREHNEMTDWASKSGKRP